MSKLLKLKQWLTVNEAAKYLSGILCEPVTEADIFRLSLDGALTLSVYFVSSIHGNIGKPIPIAMARRTNMVPLMGMEPSEIILGVRINSDTEVLEFEDQILSMSGIVFDVPMIGGERISCEQEYQRLTNGPHVEMTNIDGTFLQVPDSLQYVRVKESYRPEPREGDTRSVWERIRDKVWYPLGVLPEDAVFVVRIESLTKLLASLITEDSLEKSLSTTERSTLLTIIAVLCSEYKLDCKKHAKTAGLIHGMAQFQGVSIGESTIEGHLKKIPDALGTRTR